MYRRRRSFWSVSPCGDRRPYRTCGGSEYRRQRRQIEDKQDGERTARSPRKGSWHPIHGQAGFTSWNVCVGIAVIGGLVHATFTLQQQRQRWAQHGCLLPVCAVARVARAGRGGGGGRSLPQPKWLRRLEMAARPRDACKVNGYRRMAKTRSGEVCLWPCRRSGCLRC